jgi:pectate lyase
MRNYQTKYIYCCVGVMILSLITYNNVNALTVVPNLYGFGTETRAAYGAANNPEICIVDDLTDNAGNPEWDASSYSIGVFKGSLLQCLEGLDTTNGETIDGHVVAADSGKVVLFEVSGTITESAGDGADDYMYRINNYTTIAGQTAPNPGILLRNICLSGIARHDILIQHVRVRMDGPPSLKHFVHKGLNFSSAGSTDVYNIVIDHVSSSWGADSNMEFFDQYGTGKPHNITIANSILAEPRENMGLIGNVNNSGMNSLVGDQSKGSKTENILFYGNLFSNSRKRNPRSTQTDMVMVNNYLYNNHEFGVMIVAANEAIIFTGVGNVSDAGPMSAGVTTVKHIFGLIPEPWSTENSGPWYGPTSQHRIYLHDNGTDYGVQSNSRDWHQVWWPSANTTVDADCSGASYNAYGCDFAVIGEDPPKDAPLWPPGLKAEASGDVKNYIISNVGAYPAFRDAVDERLIREMETGTGPSAPVKGAPNFDDWPKLAAHKIKLAIPVDPHGDNDGDGYTNLEDWLHGLSDEVENKSSNSSMPPPTNLRLVTVDID